MAELLSIQQYGSPPHEQKWSCRTFNPTSKKYGSVSSLWSTQTDYEMNRSDSMAGIIVENNNGVIGRRPPVTVTWKNITLTTKEGKTILKSVSGQVCTGELTAIMGPSGAGKSTLLNVLSGFTKQKVEGSVLVNGLERDMHVFRKLSCYIMQDDHLLSHLTVEESLTFAANLKIAGSASRLEKQKAVSDVLHSLGLTETRNTKTSQLSGGQRKRLCIAQELVSNPPVIFLDEPTSGLDSSYCLQCIKLLKSLAEDGRTVVCTIHQPSARIFEIFDKLYMLAEGNCIYRGPARSLVSFLSEQGLKCPQYHNPTDFATEVATGEHGDWILKLTKAVQCLEEEVNEDQSLPGIKTQSAEMLTLEASTQCLMQDLVNSKQLIFKEALLASSYKGFATSSFNQFTVLLHRSILCTLREPMATKLRFAAHVVVGLLLGMLYFGIGNDASKIFNNSGFLFFSLLFLIFTAMMPTVLTFPLEKTIFVREHLNSWYSTKMYYLAKTMAEIPFQVVFPVIYCSIVYWMTNQPFEIFRFGLFLLSSFMISLLAQSIGLLIGAATSVQNAVFLAPVVSIPILLFSGFFISLNAIPPYLKWVPYLSYIRYCYESVLLSIYSLDRPELKCDKAFCPFQDPVDFLKEMDMTEAKLYIDYLAQLAFFVVFRIAAYYVLRWKLTNSR